MNPYAENGFKDRDDYLRRQADEFEAPLDLVFMLADLLGPEEDFDGLIIALEYYA